MIQKETKPFKEKKQKEQKEQREQTFLEDSRKTIVESKKETSKSEKLDKKEQKLREKIETSFLSSDGFQVDVLKEAQKIKKQTVQSQIDYLLSLASQKGIFFAIKIVKAINDPLLIDLFHDILIKEGLYKKFSL